MDRLRKKINVVMADDDPDDRFLVREAFKMTRFPADLHMVSDGHELLDYLHCRGEFAGKGSSSPPALILLDLNMPHLGGLEALAQLKASESLRTIPVIVFTTSGNDTDIRRCYELGASSYIIKPSEFESLMAMVDVMGRYWTATVSLPDSHS